MKSVSHSILGAIAQALGQIGGYQDGNAGLMLSGYAPTGAPGQSNAGQRSAIVMFARVMAQCPGACVAKCALDKPYNKVKNVKVKFDWSNVHFSTLHSHQNKQRETVVDVVHKVSLVVWDHQEIIAV